jgi:hypothetical protein
VFDFVSAVDAYAAQFGKGAPLVLPYELLRDRPSDFLGAIEAALGVAPFRFAPDRVRESPQPARIATYRRMTRWVRAMPGTAALRQGASRRYIAALRTGRLAGAAAFIERLGGGGGAAGADLIVPPELLEALGVRGERLRSDPLYRDYAREYRL